MPASVEKNVASRMGMKMSVGCAACIWARYTMMLTGISVSPLVFSTKNIIIGFDAVTFSVCISLSLISPLSCFIFNVSFLISSICSIAFRPNGVAALSNPSMLAAMFMKMLPVTGCPLGMSGKSLVKMGDSRRASTLTTPPFSPTFMTPSHSDSTPVRPNEILKAVSDDSNVESIMAGNTPKSPRNTSLTAAMTNATKKNAIQI